MLRLTTALLLLAVSLGFLTSEPGIAAEPLRVGVAERDVTPPEGFPMAGYYHERLATGTIDPLKAKAVVFRQGERAAAWVVVDVTGISRDLCVAVREAASAKTGIPKEYIVVSATHSHTAPEYYRNLYDFLAGKTPAGGPPPYAAKLIEGSAAAIVAANEAVRPVAIKVGSARQETPVSFNRRFVMKDGSVQTWQRLDNPEVVRAAGPIDPEIGLALIQSADDQSPLAVLSNFALHLDTVGGLKWSADYPYFIEHGVKQELGKGVLSIFGTGACGDINHSDPSRKERNKTDFIGNSLADTIRSGIAGLEAVETPTLQVRTATVDLPLQEVTEEELERAGKLIPIAKAGEKTDFFDLVRAYKAVVLEHLRNKSPRLPADAYINWGLSHNWAGIGPSLPAEVTTITLGDDLAMVFLPAEVFVELGLAIKQGSPYRTTMVVELSNCVETIYVPTRAAYAGGSYEVTNSNVQPGSGEMLVEAALRMLRESASAD
ncbi:MAG: hypothetical protein GXY83_39895 [Rhodopirellula sp.]|nr:hypothetical protein [Rhodopirellula sp.]